MRLFLWIAESTTGDIKMETLDFAELYAWIFYRAKGLGCDDRFNAYLDLFLIP